MLWQTMADLVIKLIPLQLFERNSGLAGGLKITKVKTFRKSDRDKQNKSMEGVRMIQISGDPNISGISVRLPKKP